MILNALAKAAVNGARLQLPFLCTRASRGEMSAELTDARRASRGKEPPLLDFILILYGDKKNTFVLFLYEKC